MRYDLHNDNAAFISRKIKIENDTSITKTLSRRLDLRIKCKFDDRFVEAKAIRERLRKLNRKGERRGGQTKDILFLIVYESCTYYPWKLFFRGRCWFHSTQKDILTK